MAELISVEGETYTKRNLLGAWGLIFLTLGIYLFVWHYKVNDEARRYLRDPSIKPGIALLAVLLGWIILVPPFVSIYRTGERVQRMQERAGVVSQVSPALGLLAAFFLSLQVPYLQEGLNRIWQVFPGKQGARSELPPAPLA